MSNTDYVPGHGQVTIRNTVPHAQYHNEGATSKVTKKMKRFFWAKHYEAGGGKKKGKKPSPEADFWKAMALKKPGSRIKITKRRFLGPSPKVNKIVSDILNKELF